MGSKAFPIFKQNPIVLDSYDFRNEIDDTNTFFRFQFKRYLVAKNIRV
jgi:hypothetical protein